MKFKISLIALAVATLLPASANRRPPATTPPPPAVDTSKDKGVVSPE